MKSEHFKDVVALVISTALVTLVWVGIGGRTHHLWPDTERGSRTVGSQPAPGPGP